jgi:hypothetical protein
MPTTINDNDTANNDDFSAYHYHVYDGDSHPDNRGIYYHEHAGSFIYDDSGRIVHDHATEQFTVYTS